MALEEPNSSSMTPISDEELVGTIFADRYELLSIIGKGGMGKVYKAQHKLMRRIVAIKVVHPHLVSNAYTMARFQQEAEAASCLNHPNIVAVHDFGLLPRAYLVMDYLDGICLADLLENDAHLSLGRSLNIFVQICAALVHAHQYGVVHRDLKPSNIMLVTDDGKKDFVKIVDFGIAKLMLKENPADIGLTSTGEIFGSPHYMSPEQCRGKPMDVRSDIYSLGCIMYRTLTGQRPIPGQDLLECLYNHVTVPPGRFHDICPDFEIPDSLEVIVLKCMEKEQENRFQSMLELKDALEAEVMVVPSGNQQAMRPRKQGAALTGTVSVTEAGRAASAAEDSLAASAAEAGRAASAAEDSLAASAAESGRAASAAETGRAASAAESARAATAAEVGRAASAAEAERAAFVAEAGRAASAAETGLAALAAEAERAASAAESERAASATEPGREASAAEISFSASAAELGRAVAAVESARAASAAESARAAAVTEAVLVASAHEASLAASAREASLAASAREASLAASAHEASLAASAHEAVRAASAREAGLVASAQEAGRAASAAEAGRVASAQEADRAASAAEDKRALSDTND